MIKKILAIAVLAVILVVLGFIYKPAVQPQPPQLNTKYISPVDWPPKLEVVAGPFSCNEPRTINGHNYCVTAESEGAAGSIYTMYAYAYPRGNQTAILTFSLRFVQCANYDEPPKGECERERATFNLDRLIDQIATNWRP